MKKLLFLLLICTVAVLGCAQKTNEVEKLEVIYFCADHPYCKAAEEYLDQDFLEIDYCNLRDVNNCSESARSNLILVVTIPTLISNNKTFYGLFGILDFMNYLKENGYEVDVPSVVDLVDRVELHLKSYNNTTEMIQQLEDFKKSLNETRVYFFYSPSCPHCLAVKPFVEEFANETGMVEFCDVSDPANCTINAKIVASFSALRGVPTAVIVNSTSEKVLTGEIEVKSLKDYV